MTNNLKHDPLFKKIMEHPKAAREFLENYLPQEFKQLVDLSTIKLEKDSFVDEDLKRNISDLVYSIKAKVNDDKAFVYIVVESQSTSDYWIALRLWKYILLLAERYKTRNGKLPLIAPFVVYNGSKPYDAPRSFWELFNAPEQAKSLLGDDYRLIDLQSMPDEEIKKKKHLGMLEYFLKNIHERDMIKLWDKFLSEHKEMVIIDRDNEYFYIKLFLLYTETKVSEDRQLELKSLFTKHLPEGEEDIMRTIAQKYIDEGMQQGVQQGMQQGMQQGRYQEKIDIAKIMLRSKANITFIAEVTGLTIKQIKELK